MGFGYKICEHSNGTMIKNCQECKYVNCRICEKKIRQRLSGRSYVFLFCWSCILSANSSKNYDLILAREFFLAFFFGIFGVHRFYSKNYISGLVILMLTFSLNFIPLSLIWVVFDLYRSTPKRVK